MGLGCEWRHAQKWAVGNFGDFWKKQLVEIQTWASLVVVNRRRRVFVGSDGMVSIVKIVSLSLCRKTKSQKKLINVFVPELKKVISVSGFLCIWTFYIFV